MSTKYALPIGVAGLITRDVYVRWLGRIADAHKRRDRMRGNAGARREDYMLAIHASVVAHDGRDAYTGEPLRWDLVSRYDNLKSAAGGRQYKSEFAMKPTVDHVGDGTGVAEFQVCAWRTNQAKGDLALNEFVDLCRKIVRRQDGVTKP